MSSLQNEVIRHYNQGHIKDIESGLGSGLGYKQGHRISILLELAYLNRETDARKTSVYTRETLWTQLGLGLVLVYTREILGKQLEVGLVLG